MAPIERDLFELLIRHPEAVPAVLEKIGLDDLQSETAKEMHAKYAQLEAQGILADFVRLTLEFDDPTMKNLLVELDESAQDKVHYDTELVLQDLLVLFDRRHTEAELRSHQAVLEGSAVEEDEQIRMLEELVRKKKKIT